MSRFGQNNLRLTNEQVLAIREKRLAGASYRELGNEFGVTTETIGRICRGDSRKKVTMPKAEPTQAEIDASLARFMTILNTSPEAVEAARDKRLAEELDAFTTGDSK